MGISEYRATGGNKVLLNKYHRKKDSVAVWCINFLPYKKQEYSFDNLSYGNHGIFSTNEFYPKSGSYDFRYKSIEIGKTDYVKVDFSNYNGIKDSVVFKDRFGIKLKLSKDNILTFTGTQKPDTNYIYAYDKNGVRIGKLFVYTYKKQTKNVVLVSVNNAKIDKSITANGLNKIFKPSVTEFKISEDKLEIPELETFTHGGSNWHSVYNSDQKLVLETYDKNIKDDNFYLFFIDNVLDKKDSLETSVSGYMPRGYNCGFIYEGGSLHTVAHELGHGVGNLEHAFYSSNNSGKTQNLMDYSAGEELYHFQWNEIQDPSRVWMKWSKEESEGENIEKITGNIISLKLISNQQIQLFDDQQNPINSELLNYEQATKIKRSFAVLKGSKFSINLKFKLKNYSKDETIVYGIISSQYHKEKGNPIVLEKTTAIKREDENHNIYFEVEIKDIQLASCVDYYDSFTWYMLDEQDKEIKIGTTNNKLMVMNANVEDVDYPLCETLADIGCRNSKGKTEENDIIQDIWDLFVSLDIKNINGNNMFYWKDNSDANNAQNLSGLLANGNGTCHAWSSLLYYVLKYQGFTNIKQYMITSIYNNSDGSRGELSTKCFNNNTNLSDEIFTPIEIDEYSCKSPCYDAGGQNNKTMSCIFENHYVVVYNNLMYDPSYGKGPYIFIEDSSIESEWEKKSIGVFIKKNNNGKNIAKINKDKISELIFIKVK